MERISLSDPFREMRADTILSNGSPEQRGPDVMGDSPFTAASDTMGCLGGAVSPWHSELNNAVAGYDNDQRNGEVPCKTFHRFYPSEYEAQPQAHQYYFQFGEFPATPLPTLAARPDVLDPPVNAGYTRMVGQYSSCGCTASGTACASNSSAVDMTASPAHHDGGCHLFNSYPDHYYPSVVAASSHVPPPSPNGSPKISVPYSVSGSSESSARRHSSPVHMGGGPQPPEIPDSGSLVADYDPHLVHNPTPEAFFYPCSFDTCQGWISDDRRLMMDHLAHVHHIYLRGDPKSPIKCRWEGCTSAMMKGNFLRHVLIHLQDRWECSVCKKSGTRSDSVSAHIKDSEECFGGTPTKLVSPLAYRCKVLGDEVVLTKVLGG